MSAEYAQAPDVTHDGIVIHPQQVSGRKTCPCGASMFLRPRQATYCEPCRLERKRDQDRRTKRAQYRGTAVERFCPCGAEREAKAKFCPPCTAGRKKLSFLRYYTATNGAAQKKYHASPKGKIKRSLYADAHVQERRLASRRYSVKNWKRGPIQCATVLCPNTFIRSYRGGARKFCDECRLVFQGPARVRQMERARQLVVLREMARRAEVAA